MQINFITVYLNSKLKKDIFINQYFIFKKYFVTYLYKAKYCGYLPERIIKLINSLYGLK